MSEPSIDRDRLGRFLTERLGDRRWFAAKSSTVERVDVRGWWPVGVDVAHLVIRVDTADGNGGEYQVPLIEDPDATDPLYVDESGRRWADALATPAGIAAYAPLFAGQADLPAVDPDGPLGFLEFRSISDGFDDVAAVGAPLGVEQSNTSVVLDGRVMVKFFRRLAAGENPDVEVHRALGTVDCPHVARLRGFAQTTIDGRVTTIAMAQDFLAGAVDGWAATLDALRAGAVDDLAASAERLGEAVAVVHRDLRRSLGGGEIDAAEVTAGLAKRIDDHIRRVPQLAGYADRAAALVAAAADAGPIDVHRVHGDLHLGQVLEVDGRWFVIDFEGEPATDPEERRAPDSQLRDVAGMLRSFDYAAAVAGGSAEVVAGANNAADAFRAGYARTADVEPEARAALLAAYELDKAVYEVDYEARNRPDWIGVPLSAVERILGR